MKTRVLQINYPSLEATSIGRVAASIREQILAKFPSNQVSFSFSNTKESGYIMIYPTQPILSIRVSNHAPIGGAVAPYAIQAEGNKVVINAEHELGQKISEDVLYETLEQIKKQCEEMQANLIKQ